MLVSIVIVLKNPTCKNAYSSDNLRGSRTILGHTMECYFHEIYFEMLNVSTQVCQSNHR